MKRRTIACLVLLLGWSALTGRANDTAQTTADTVQSEVTALTQKWELPLPSEYNGVDLGKKPRVQKQEGESSCWAIAAVSALEASLLPENASEFSAEHLIEQNAFTVNKDEGGDHMMIMAYLSGWQGPVVVSDATAESGDARIDGEPEEDDGTPEDGSTAVHVQEMQLLDQADTEELKKAVYEYGAVQTSLYMSRSETEQAEYYNAEAAAYYYPEAKTQNHDVLILGWDDTYSRFRFGQVPDRDGAFICQNSWGSDFGKDGIFYVSYADANIGCAAIAYTRIESVDNYKNIYQTDDCGWRGLQGYDDETCWFANVYTAQEQEQLSAAGFYATGENTSYEIYLIRDFAGEASFEQRTFLQAGEFERAGYYTVDLEKPVSMEAGERFAVAVKITTAGTKNPVAVEYRANLDTQNVTVQGKEGYLSQTGEHWENTEERFESNVCLKVYTR